MRLLLLASLAAAIHVPHGYRVSVYATGLHHPTAIGFGPDGRLYVAQDTGQVVYSSRTDDEALAAIELLARTEGILPALETAHAIAALHDLAKTLGPDAIIIVGLSGRGDKDMVTIAQRRPQGGPR